MSRKLILGKDRIGNKSGKLEIIDYFPEYNKVTGLSDGYFSIKCECGNTITRGISHIGRFNKMKHCGCETYLDRPWERIFNRWVFHLGYNKNSLKQTTTINLEQFILLSSANCYYCNAEPENLTRIKGYLISGIDRINNDIGYDYENCRTCCSQCNYAKSDTHVGDFLEWIERAAKHQATNR